MSSAEEDSEFIESGKHCAESCHQPDKCEITLKFTEITPVKEFKTHLFVCGGELTKHCSYFERLLLGFKENDQKEANVHDVTRCEMIMFLQYAMHPDRSLPLGKDSLCTLIKVSDIFICEPLQQRIALLLNTESFFFNAPAETRLQLIQTADQHRGSSWEILDACCRSCTNLPRQHRALLTKLSRNYRGF